MRLVALPGNEALAARLAALTGADLCPLETRQFPDGETYVRLAGPVAGERVVLVCTLAQPDSQFLRLSFTAAAAREAGAARVELAAPYMAYMRQDRRFADGEATSARAFARLLSASFDAIFTIDPHLHRISALSQVFNVRAVALHAAPLLAAWIRDKAPDSVLIGPDSESRQWVEAIAAEAQRPYAVLTKRREGDRSVSITLPDLAFAKGLIPVLVDDIISSGQTALQAARMLRDAGFDPPDCLAVHGIFAGEAYEQLSAVCRRVVTTDTVPQPSAAICVAPLLAQALSG